MQFACNHFVLQVIRWTLKRTINAAVNGSLVRTRRRGKGGYKFNTTHRWAPSEPPVEPPRPQSITVNCPIFITFLLKSCSCLLDTNIEVLRTQMKIRKCLPFGHFQSFGHVTCKKVLPARTNCLLIDLWTRRRLNKAELYSMGWRDCFGSILRPNNHQADQLLISTLHRVYSKGHNILRNMVQAHCTQ